MKQILVAISFLALTVSAAMSQEKSGTRLPQLGENAPSFVAKSTNGTIDFPKDYEGSWKIIFSHPADFTPVCTSEILELAQIQDDLKKMNTRCLVVSADDLDKHNQWLKSMESLKYKDRETPKINFALVDDHDLSIAHKYGMIQPGVSTVKDVRGVFLIDPKNKVRAMFYYPMEVGRNVDEIKRTLVALQTVDKNKVLTPANWQAGNDVLLPYVKNTDDKGGQAKSSDPDTYQVAWYMTFKKM